MRRPPPRRPGPPGKPPSGKPQAGRPAFGGRPGQPPRQPRKEEDAPDRRAGRGDPQRRPEAAPARESAAAPSPRGRDRRGMNDPRPTRAPDPAPAPKPGRPQEKEATPPGSLWIHGLHAVAAALANPRRRARRLLLTADAEAELARRVPKPWRCQAEVVERHRFQTFLPEDAVHQGAALLVEPLTPLALEQAVARSDGPVLLLDQVTDPRNVGAILRSAAAFGAACVVMQDRHAPPETGALARAASGALESVPIAREVNLARAIMQLQRAGFWVLGLAGDATRTLAEAAPRDRRVALVLGAEDAGLRRLQRETCDELVRLPIAAGMESLNVSAAAAVALYEVVRHAPPGEAQDEDGDEGEPLAEDALDDAAPDDDTEEETEA